MKNRQAQDGFSLIELMIVTSITVVVALYSTQALQGFMTQFNQLGYTGVENTIIQNFLRNANFQGLKNSAVLLSPADNLLNCITPPTVGPGVCTQINQYGGAGYTDAKGNPTQPIKLGASKQPGVFVSGAPPGLGLAQGTGGQPMVPLYFDRNGRPQPTSATADFMFYTTYFAGCASTATTCTTGFLTVQIYYVLTALTAPNPTYTPNPAPAPPGGPMYGVRDLSGSVMINLASNQITVTPTTTPTGGAGPPTGTIQFTDIFEGNGSTYGHAAGTNMTGRGAGGFPGGPVLMPAPCATATPSCYPNNPGGFK